MNLQCTLLSSQYTVSDCQFERPDGGIFLLKNGANSGRYTYYGKGIESNVCGISIDLPLTKEDIGVWTCKMHLSNGPTTGGFLVVDPEDGKKGKNTTTAQDKIS